jgi:hypothetical protein
MQNPDLRKSVLYLQSWFVRNFHYISNLLQTFVEQAPTPEDVNLVTSSEDKVHKVCTVHSFTQTPKKVSINKQKSVWADCLPSRGQSTIIGLS